MSFTPAELVLTQANQDSIRVLTLQPDGTLSDTYANQYSLYFVYDEDGNVLDLANDADAQQKARFYTIYSAYSNRYYFYYGEVGEQVLHPGDTHTYELDFQRTLPDGTTATARVQVVVTME